MLNQDFIISDDEVLESDIRLFFLLPDEKIDIKEFTILPSATMLEDIMVLANIFPSKTIARKSGFGGKISTGFTKSGTKKKPIWILKLPF